MSKLDATLHQLRMMSHRKHHTAQERQALVDAARLLVELSNEQAAKAWKEANREEFTQ